MKRFNVIIKLISLMLLASIIVIALAACDGNNDTVPGSDEENLCLVYEGKVNFQIVASSDLDTKGIKQVTDLIAELNDLGLDIPEEPVSDKEAEQVKACEIIIGTGVKNREGCSVDEHELGDDGFVIKIVGDRVIVAAGSNSALKEAIELFKKKVMGISAKVDTLEGQTVTVERKYKGEQITEYPIASVQIGNESLNNYYFSFDSQSVTAKSVVNKLRQAIYDRSGFWLKLESDLPEGQTAAHKFIVRVVDDLGEDNFKVYVSGSDLIMESTSTDRMQKGADAFVNKYLDEKVPSSRFYATDTFIYDVVALHYSEYGAVGDGKTDDFNAIMSTHQAANVKGVKVMAEAGAKYYFGTQSHRKTIPVQTDVDWLDAEFIVDDSIILPTGPRGYHIFQITSKNPKVTIYANGASSLPEGQVGSFDGGADDDGILFFGKSSTSVPDAIKQFITAKSLVTVFNEDHQIYVRYGNNSGSDDLREMLIVNPDGTINLEETPISWDYDKFTKITVQSVEDDPITIKGGKITTKANQIYYGFTQDELNDGWLKGPQYYYYSRGFNITRANVTIKGLEHYITGEGSEGYPYAGFFSVGAYKFLAEDCILTGHRRYHENRPNGLGTDMGSYDINIGGAICTTFKNCIQSNKITDRNYWGIMCGNFGKNIAYDGCTLSRFDAHTGIWNAKVVNTTLGHSFSLIGGGDLYVENVKKVDDGSAPTFLTFRGDYGSIWHGDVTIKNCTMETEHPSGIKSISVIKGDWKSEWKGWDFGYELMMPQNITIENFTCPGADIYILNWSGLCADSLTCQYPVNVTKSVKVINQTQPIRLASPGSYIYTIWNDGGITVTGDNIS